MVVEMGELEGGKWCDGRGRRRLLAVDYSRLHGGEGVKVCVSTYIVAKVSLEK